MCLEDKRLLTGVVEKKRVDKTRFFWYNRFVVTVRFCKIRNLYRFLENFTYLSHIFYLIFVLLVYNYYN